MKKFVTIMAKCLEVFFLGFAAVALGFAIASGIAPEKVYSLLKCGLDSNIMTVLGFAVQIADEADMALKLPMILLFAFSVPATLNLVMIFRNVFLIYRTADGKTKFSKGKTPFQKDIVRMVREIGIFSIGIPVIHFIGSTVIALCTRNTIEVSAPLTGIIFGIVVLSISEFFAYGMKLEEDVEGLV